ncbi:hypothetical protein Ddye_007915 [Dipteronia dyeriana]|uniref:Uncharacterized protein n=1 Tax=Dipteronia dyeriana TaxID=168575 RepID=A0AAD9XLG4_9ROSI|nr:hypothetical protein Ddye_007915 [Dipteronia dyeriana]
MSNTLNVSYFTCRNIGATKLVIYHSGSWVGNCYEGGMTKWVNVPRGLSYDALVKLVQDVVKVDTARYNLQLCSLAFTNSGTTRPRIENDNDVSCTTETISAFFSAIQQTQPLTFQSVV